MDRLVFNPETGSLECDYEEMVSKTTDVNRFENGEDYKGRLLSSIVQMDKMDEKEKKYFFILLKMEVKKFILPK